MRSESVLALMLLAYLLPILALAASDEASGVVTNVVDGDTFDLRIEKTDPRILHEIERVRLADVDSPEMSAPEGPLAKEFTRGILLNRTVWLDIDDQTIGGRGPHDCLICVVYLNGSNGRPIAAPPINRILVDSGYAKVNDFDANEFDPNGWWAASEMMYETATMWVTPAPSQFPGSPLAIKIGLISTLLGSVFLAMGLATVFAIRDGKAFFNTKHEFFYNISTPVGLSMLYIGTILQALRTIPWWIVPLSSIGCVSIFIGYFYVQRDLPKKEGARK